MNKDYFSIIGKSGAFFVFKPHITDNPDFILVVAPGLAEHAARYARLSEFMKNHNVQLYCIDHIGHGVYTESLGIWPVDGFFECVSNMNSLVEYVRKQHPDKKVILFGHSMGSFMTLAFAERYASNIDGCVLSGTNDQQPAFVLGAGRFIAAFQELFIGRNKPSKILNALSFGAYNSQFKPNRTEFDWLSRNESEVDKYVDDPLCGYVPSVGMFKELFKGLSVIYKKESIAKIPKALPIHSFCGSDDPVGGNSKGPLALVARLQNAGINNVTSHVFEDMRHECLNEIGNDVVMKHVYEVCKGMI